MVRTVDASLAVQFLHPTAGRLLVVGDHFQMGVIMHNDFSDADAASDEAYYRTVRQRYTV